MLTGKPYLAVKKARIARAGKQLYTAQEMKVFCPTFEDTGKGIYAQMRPAEVLIKNLDKFNYVPFIDEHTKFDLTPDNWKNYAIGVVGGKASIEVVNDEAYVTNDIIFYDRKAYEEYQNGKVELSARYDAKFGVVEDDSVGYSSVLLDIPAVNHVALVSRARAGHEARIMDSASFGGIPMKKGFLSFLGLGKGKDDSFSLSAVLMDSLVKVKDLDAAGVETEVSGIVSHVAKFGDSEAKEVLVGAIADCFKNPEVVLGAKDTVAKKLDELYAKCQDADTEVVKRILDGKSADAADDKDDKKKDDDKKDGKDDGKKDADAKDAKANDGVDVDAIVDKVCAKLNDSIAQKIDAAVKGTLGLDAKAGDAKTKVDAAKLADDAAAGEDASFLVRGVFGMR